MLTFYAYNKVVSFQWIIFKQTNVQDHKVVNLKLRIGIIIARNFSIYMASFHIKIDGNRAVWWTFDRALIISRVMVNFITRHTLKLTFYSLYHMLITHETKTTLIAYMSYTGWLWRVLQYYPLILVTSIAHWEINGASDSPHQLYGISIRFTCKCKRLI